VNDTDIFDLESAKLISSILYNNLLDNERVHLITLTLKKWWISTEVLRYERHVDIKNKLTNDFNYLFLICE